MAPKPILNTFISIFLALAPCIPAAAAEHHGIVKFGGLPVPGATVTAIQGDKKQVAITDGSGVYGFADLPDGVWNLQVEMLTFAPAKMEVAVAPNAPSPEWELKLLPFDEIKASAPPPPGIPAVPTANGTPATNATSVAPGTASPGTAPAPTAATAAPAANGKGGKAPKKGSKEELAAATAASNARPGFQRADLNANASAAPANEPAPPAGGGVDEASASNGANDALLVNGSVSNGVERRAIGNFRKGPGWAYRGDMMGVFDNSWLNARAYSITGQDTPQPAYNHIRYGASFGGPLAIPHLFRTNNGNFFLNYQGARNRNASNQTSLMPTAAERSGDLSKTVNALGQPVVAIDPDTGAPFPNGIIPSNRISPQAAALLGFYPAPNFAASHYNFQIPLVGIANSDAIQSRINKSWGQKNSLNGSFGFQSSRAENPNQFAFTDTNRTRGMNLSLSWRHTFTRNVFGTATATYSRQSIHDVPFFANRTNVSGAAGITGNNQEAVNWGPPSLSFSSGIAGLSDGISSFTRNQTSALGYQVMWLKRPHNLTLGGDVRRIQLNYLGQQNPRGNFGFTGAYTQATQNGAAVASSGSDFADFLLGVPDTSNIAFGNADKYFRYSSYDGYITDDWRVGAGLTLNLGARWEYSSPIVEKYGRLVNLDIADGFTRQAPVVASNPVGPVTGRHYPDSLVRPTYGGLQPRLALSWRPIFGSSLLIRGGYGMTLNTSVYNSLATQMAQQSPLSKSLSVPNSIINPLTLADGFNAAPNITTNTFALDPDFRVGNAQNWQASAQMDLPKALVATVTYNGIKGTRAMQAFLPNTYPAGVIAPCLTCLSGYTYVTSNGNSTRESGTFQLRRRLHNGLTATGQYTYSRSFDNAILGGKANTNSMIAQNWLDLSAERGPSNFDQRHMFTLQTQFSSGVGVKGGALLHGWRAAAYKGWTLVTNMTVGSGLPQSPVYLTAVKGTGVTGPLRPDVTGISVQEEVGGRHLNPAAYAAPKAGQWGNAGRNSIVGPGQFTLNASLGRTFAENLDLRFDSTNVLNRVTYPGWNTVVNGAQFGLPNTANQMRNLQGTLRWRF
ncbi:MAG: TonB-dependent receptor [Candidatus Solibacter sp.]